MALNFTCLYRICVILIIWFMRIISCYLNDLRLLQCHAELRVLFIMVRFIIFRREVLFLNYYRRRK